MILFIGHDPGNNATRLKGALAALAVGLAPTPERVVFVAEYLYKQPDRKALREWFAGLEQKYHLEKVYLCSEALFLGKNVASLKKLQQAVERVETVADGVFGDRLKTSEVYPSTWHAAVFSDGKIDHATALLFAKARALAITGRRIDNEDLCVAVCLAEYQRIETKWGVR